MKIVFKPFALAVSLFIASLWLLWLYFLSQNLLDAPGSMGRALKPWYQSQNIISSLIIFLLSYSVSFIRIKSLSKISSSRLLGTSEYLWYRMGQLSSNNFVMVAELEGELDEDALKEALSKVIKSQPMLRSIIKKDGRKIRLLEFSSAPAEFIIVPRENENSWQMKAEEEMNHEIALDAIKLWRFTWLKGEGKHELLMTLNHMIADGRSGLNFFEMLFRVLADKDFQPEVLPLFPAYENQLKNTDGPFSTSAKFLKAFREYRSSKKEEWNKISTTENKESYSSLICRKASPDLVENLLENCRGNQATMSSYLAALMLNLADGNGSTALSLAADMRPYLTSIKGNEIGYFVTSLDLVKNQNNSGEKWELARKVKERIDGQLNKGQFLFDQMIRYLAFKSSGTNEGFKQLIKKALSNSMLLTNIGRVDMPSDYGAFKLKACFHVPSVHLMGVPFFCLAVSTLEGEMVLNFTYNKGCMKLADAEALVEKFMASLKSV